MAVTKNSPKMNREGRTSGGEILSVIFMFAYFVLPQYFGVDTPFFDFTAQRIMIVVFFLYLFSGENRLKKYGANIGNACGIIWFLLYMLVLTYTAIFRSHLGTIMYSLIEFLALFIVVYIVREELGVKRFFELMRKFCCILCILGIVEYFLKQTPFSYLETIKGTYCGPYIRAGSYRIMGPANHALAYGLILITMLPYIAVDIERDEIDIFNHPLTFVLLTTNIFLTGSRSTLGIYFLEIVILFLFSPRKNKRKMMTAIVVVLLVAVPVLLVTRNMSFSRYVLRTFFSVVDQIFGTSIAVRYGADVKQLNNSAIYREQLKLLYKANWLNPLLGQGFQIDVNIKMNGFFISSIDDGYLALYIRYGYPGMITYILFILTVGITILVQGIKTKSGCVMAMFAGTVGYFVNLKYMDTLQTIKYAYVLFAVFFAMYESKTKILTTLRYKQEEPITKTRMYSYVK